MVRLLAERSDTKSNVKLGGFRFQLQASYVSSHTEELWYNETVCLWMTIYLYIYIYKRRDLQWTFLIHLKKKHSCPTTELQKILTDNATILEHQNNKQKLQILEALHIRNMQPTLNRINFKTSANVLKYL